MKKRIISCLLTGLLVIEGASAVKAEEPIKALIDGVEIAFDQPPVIKNGRTLVPVRAVTEALGAEVSVDFEGGSRIVTISKDGNEILLTIDDNNALVNGASQLLDVPASIMGDRTMVPIRFISENFDLNVEWDGESRTIFILSQESESTGPESPTADEDGLSEDSNLINAIIDNDKELLLEAIENGADVNLKYDSDGLEIPIIGACIYNHEFLKILIENGADVNAPIPIKTRREKGVLYLLDYAISDGDVEMVKYLLSHGANGDYTNMYGKDAYNMAKDYISDTESKKYEDYLNIFILFSESDIKGLYYYLNDTQIEEMLEVAKSGKEKLEKDEFFEGYIPLKGYEKEAEYSRYLTITVKTPYYRTISAIVNEEEGYPKGFDETKEYYTKQIFDNKLYIEAYIEEENYSESCIHSFKIFQNDEEIEDVDYPEFEGWINEKEEWNVVPGYYWLEDIGIPLDKVDVNKKILLIAYRDGNIEYCRYEFVISDYK